MKKRKKKIVDWEVAVIYSPWFWAGWSTRAEDEQQEQLIFDSRIVEKIEKWDIKGIDKEFLESIWLNNIYLWWAYKLRVVYISIWGYIRIDEYDWSEWIETKDDYNWFYKL